MAKIVLDGTRKEDMDYFKKAYQEAKKNMKNKDGTKKKPKKSGK